MKFSERLYAVKTGEKLLAAFWSRGARAETATAAPSAQVRNDLDGRVVVLTNLAISLGPGGAQTALTAYAELIPPDGSSSYVGQHLIAVRDTEAVNRVTGLYWQGDLIVPPLWYVRASGTFNAGVAANVVIMTAMGYAIPIGTLAAA